MPAEAKLSKARVHIGGMGRLGTAIALSLQAAGVRHIRANDPQVVEREQLASLIYARRSDLGKPKVDVVARFLDGRPEVAFEPVFAPNESAEIARYLEEADVIVSCANRLPARLCLERAAVKLRKPAVQASVQDARRSRGGLVSVWSPGHDRSCFGCLFPRPNIRFPRGEVLPAGLISIVGAVAAQRIIDLLTGQATAIDGKNLLVIDLDRYAIEAMSVKPREGCRVCGAGRRPGKGSQ